MLIEMVSRCRSLTVTTRMLTQLFKGSKEKSLKKFNQLPHIGAGAHLGKENTERLIHDLISKEALRESTKFTQYGSLPYFSRMILLQGHPYFWFLDH